MEAEIGMNIVPQRPQPKFKIFLFILFVWKMPKYRVFTFVDLSPEHYRIFLDYSLMCMYLGLPYMKIYFDKLPSVGK